MYICLSVTISPDVLYTYVRNCSHVRMYLHTYVCIVQMWNIYIYVSFRPFLPTVPATPPVAAVLLQTHQQRCHHNHWWTETYAASAGCSKEYEK